MVGDKVGFEEGKFDGLTMGIVVVGENDGRKVGKVLGGGEVGLVVGLVGDIDGFFEGLDVGIVGEEDGLLGDQEGIAVGVTLYAQHTALLVAGQLLEGLGIDTGNKTAGQEVEQ